MRFPPIKADRGLLWLSLQPDATVTARYAALRAILKQCCRWHPLDTTPAAEIVVVETAALRAHLDAVRAALGAQDMLHLITANGDRLAVEVIAGPEAAADETLNRPLARRPAWQQDADPS